ncbi:MAG TPA: glycosyltransferase family 39 protein [Pyrinomonadaceae bacterium]
MLTETADALELRSKRSERSAYAGAAWYIIGIALVAIALMVPSEQYSLSLSGGSKDLSWGPYLFRALLVFHGVMLIFLATGSLQWLTRSSSVANEKEAINPTTVVALIALSALALILRLWNLNSAPWIDEVLTLVDFVRLPINEIVITFPSQNQHMLYSVLARGAFAIFGEGTGALRLPAVMFGIGSIWALFFFARSVTGTREALLACGLMTVSYHHVWFSQNGRGYTGLLMMTLLATWAWIEAIRQDRWKWWALYIAAIVAGMWIHMTMAFVVASHGLVYALFLVSPKLSGDVGETALERRAGVKPLVAWLLSVTVTLQLYALSLPEFIRTGLHEESRGSEWTNPIWVLTESIQNLSIGFGGLAVVSVAAAFVGLGWISIFRRDRRAALLMVLPPFLSGGLMLVLGHNLFPRFFFFAMGFGILIVIHGAFETSHLILRPFGRRVQMPRLAARVGVVSAIFMIAVSLATVPRNYALPKQDFAAARDYVESQLATGSTAVAVNLAGDMFAKYYAPNWTTTRDASELDLLERENDQVWLVYTMPFEIQAFSPDLWKSIQNDFEIVRIFPGTLNGGEVVVCRSRGYQVKK